MIFGNSAEALLAHPARESLRIAKGNADKDEIYEQRNKGEDDSHRINQNKKRGQQCGTGD